MPAFRLFYYIAFLRMGETGEIDRFGEEDEERFAGEFEPVFMKPAGFL